MKNKYLVINAESSSLKFSLYEMTNSNEIITDTLKNFMLNPL